MGHFPEIKRCFFWVQKDYTAKEGLGGWFFANTQQSVVKP